MLSDQSEKTGIPTAPNPAPNHEAYTTVMTTAPRSKHWSKTGMIFIFLLIILGSTGFILFKHELMNNSTHVQSDQALTSDQKANKELLEKTLSQIGFGKPTSEVFMTCEGTDSCVPFKDLNALYRLRTKWPTLSSFVSQAKSKAWKYEYQGADDSQKYNFYKVVNGIPVCLELGTPANGDKASVSVNIHTDVCSDKLASIKKVNFKIFVPKSIPARYTTVNQHIDQSSARIVYSHNSTDGAGNFHFSTVAIDEGNNSVNIGSTTYEACVVSCKIVLTTPKGTVLRELYNDYSYQRLIFSRDTTYVTVERDIGPTTPTNEQLSDQEIATAVDSMQETTSEQLNRMYAAY